MEIIQYTPQLRVVNLEMLAKGRGFPYLLAVKGNTYSFKDILEFETELEIEIADSF